MIFVLVSALVVIVATRGIEKSILPNDPGLLRSVIVFGPTILFWVIVAEIMLARQDQCPPEAGTADTCAEMLLQCTIPMVGVGVIVCAYSIVYLIWRGFLELTSNPGPDAENTHE
jgi:hypothetical protein